MAKDFVGGLQRRQRPSSKAHTNIWQRHLAAHKLQSAPSGSSPSSKAHTATYMAAPAAAPAPKLSAQHIWQRRRQHRSPKAHTATPRKATRPAAAPWSGTSKATHLQRHPAAQAPKRTRPHVWQRHPAAAPAPKLSKHTRPHNRCLRRHSAQKRPSYS